MTCRSAFRASLRSFAAIALVSTTRPAPSNAQTQIPPQRSEAIALMRVCRGDYDRLCGSVRPGGGRVLACLKGHASQLSPACGQAMTRAQSLKDGALAAGVTPK
jgi:hypothetical protein